MQTDKHKHSGLFISLSHTLSLSPDSAVSVFVYVCAASRDVNIKTTSVMSQARWAATAGARKSQLPHLKNTHTLTYITDILTPLQTQSLRIDWQEGGSYSNVFWGQKGKLPVKNQRGSRW